MPVAPVRGRSTETEIHVLFEQVRRPYLPFGFRSVEELTSVLLCPYAHIALDASDVQMLALSEGGLLQTILESRVPDVTSRCTIGEILRHFAYSPRPASGFESLTHPRRPPFGPDETGADTLLFLTRFLSVVRLMVRLSDRTASASRTMTNIPQGQKIHYPYLARHPLGMLVPNGNIDQMLVLLWRFLVAFANDAMALRVRSEVIKPELLSEDMNSLYGGIGVCPGYDLNKWRAVVPDAQTCDALAIARDRSIPLAWSGTGTAHGMRECVRIAESIRRQIKTMPEPPDRLPYTAASRSVDAFPERMHAYHVRCHQALRLVSLALRILGHSAWTATEIGNRFNASSDSPQRITGSASATYVRSVRSLLRTMAELAKFDSNLLDTFLTRAYMESDLPMTAVYHAERDLAQHIARHGWRAVEIAWGIRPGDADAPSRCGPYVSAETQLVDLFDFQFWVRSIHSWGMDDSARLLVLQTHYKRAVAALVGNATTLPGAVSSNAEGEAQLHRERVNAHYNEKDEGIRSSLERFGRAHGGR